jgi:hypothetical protein
MRMHMEHRGKLKIDSPEEMVFLMFWSSLLSKVPYLFAESLLHCLQRKRSYPTLHKLVHNVCCYMYIFIRLPALQLLLSLSMSVTSASRFLIRSIEHGKAQAHTSMQSPSQNMAGRPIPLALGTVQLRRPFPAHSADANTSISVILNLILGAQLVVICNQKRSVVFINHDSMHS